MRSVACRFWRRSLRHAARGGVAALGLAATLAAAGCASQNVSAPDEINTGRPVTLAPPSELRSSATPGITLGPVDEAELAKAIERYRIKMDRADSPVRSAGVDLTGDGRPEALVLFTGADWCTTTGCSFIVFRRSETGYEPVSRTTRVRGPVMVGAGANSGWRDLIVKTGGGAAPVRFVRLGFTGNGYPANALLQPEPTDTALAQSAEVIPEVDFASSGAQASSTR